MADRLREVQVFDPTSSVAIVERRLPHWSQPGTISFITWRCHDSLPNAVLARWHGQRSAWLMKHGIDPVGDRWRIDVQALDRPARAEFWRMFSERWQGELDSCHGDCVLRKPELAQIVGDSLHHFDDNRYELTDFVVMPNHVHILAAFPDEDAMLKQCESWKHYTATRINRILGRTGTFWQQDGFDHLVRTLDQFDYLRRYIADNPRRANLKPGEYLHFSKELTEAPARK